MENVTTNNTKYAVSLKAVFYDNERIKLEELGYRVIKQSKNRNKPEFNVYYFEGSQDFLADLDIVKNEVKEEHLANKAKPKYKVIFSAEFVDELAARGFTYVKCEESRDHVGKMVYFYELTPEMDAAFNEIMLSIRRY